MVTTTTTTAAKAAAPVVNIEGRAVGKNVGVEELVRKEREEVEESVRKGREVEEELAGIRGGAVEKNVVEEELVRRGREEVEECVVEMDGEKGEAAAVSRLIVDLIRDGKYSQTLLKGKLVKEAMGVKPGTRGDVEAVICSGEDEDDDDEEKEDDNDDSGHSAGGDDVVDAGDGAGKRINATLLSTAFTFAVEFCRVLIDR